MREKENLTKLGSNGTTYSQDYDPQVLETFINKHPDNDYFVKFNCPEFTSLCPITGQPDFATITISYVPSERMVRIQRFFPLVITFNLDNIIEFENSPKRYPAKDAKATLGVVPNTVLYAS